VKELLKSVHICQSYRKNKSGPVFSDSQCIYVYSAYSRPSNCSWLKLGTPSHSFGVSLAEWDHTVLPAPDTSEHTPP